MSKARTSGVLNLFIPITKVDEENRLVYGVLAAEEVDHANETFDYDSSKPLFEKWSNDQFEASNGLSKGNVRAMHTSIAAGKLTDIAFDDANKIIEGCAKVVDEGEWQKVLEGVYTGFSMGGRYVKRWQDNGSTRYTAEPVEMSLVDKPCIKSATFAGMTKSHFTLLKADGTTEERLFKGADSMFVPTNDQILGRAQQLAKAAGQEGDADWLSFSDQAREQLVKEHEGEALVPEATETPTEAVAAEDTATKTVEAVAAPGDASPSADVATTDAASAAVTDDATKADAPELEQVWKAKDGTTFSKKADAIAHNEAIAKAAPVAEPTLADRLAALQKDVAAVAAGDTNEEPVPVGDDPIEVRLGKFADFLTAEPVEELRKGLYEVSRTATVMRDAASLFVCINNEAKREGDSSDVPATIMTAVQTLGDALIDMATEEVGELMAALQRQDEGTEVVSYYYDDVYCHLAANTLGLEKDAATAFFTKAISISGKDQARLQKIHDHSAALGAVCGSNEESGDDAEVAAAGTDAEKLAKAVGMVEENELLKAEVSGLRKQIDDSVPVIEQLAKDVAALKALPRPAAPRTHVVEKGADAGAGAGSPQSGETRESIIAKAVAELGPEKVADIAIRAAQQNGHTVFAARS